ncbi:glycosyltransferase family 4 protein [Paracoccaceae bacterium Fryx2]|nr:glycosyltransferase family 4 protein [Paracoccaceae bacterium Fryx2]
MTPRPAAFAVPGDITQKTGGYIYEHRMLQGLRDAGRAVAHLELAASFPAPSPAEMAQAVALMAAVPGDVPLIIDGLVFGAVDTAGLALVRAPIVAMIHHPLGLETGLTPDRARPLLQREAANLTLAAHVVVPSPHTAAILAADFAVTPDRITIAPPGVDRPLLPQQPQNPPLILSVGLLAARKGHDVLIDALSRITDLEWSAEIVGGTHDAAVADALHRQGRALGGRLRLAGLLDDAALQARYRAATIFALATRYEGYGMVFAEAMAHGLPIVTCATGAVPDTVTGAAGLLLPTDDAAAFAGGLRLLLTDAARRGALAAGSARRGQGLPGWQGVADAMGRVLDRL